MKESAGTLLYRFGAHGLEVLIVRPSGPAARWGWSLPKGEVEPGESPEQAARRETAEETGCVAGALAPLGEVIYKSRSKRVHGFAGPAPAEAQPGCRSWEIDRAEFMPLAEAEKRLHVDQRAFIARLVALLGDAAKTPPSRPGKGSV